MPNVTEISSRSFVHNESLEEIILESITEIPDCAFSDATYNSIPEVHPINTNYRDKCRNALKKIYAPNVTSVGDYAFYYCTSLTDVNLPNATSIGDFAFYYCTAMTDISLPNATSIGNYAFYNCTAMTDISLPNVTSIGNNAFNNCTNLTDIYLPNAQDTYTGAPWGAVNATIHYNCEFDENGVPLESIEEGE